MAYTEEQVKALEKQATLAARARKAEQSILKTERGPSFEEESHAKMMAAHDRFMDRRRGYVMRNPSAVPVREREMILGDIQREGLRKHEMDMLDKRNAGMISVAEKNAEGLRNQGLGVVEANNKYRIEHGNEHDKNMRTLDHEHAMALAEKQRQSAIDLETQRGKNAKTLAEAQNAGAEKVETIRGKYGVKQAAEQAKGLIAREQMRHEDKQDYIRYKIQKDFLDRGLKLNIKNLDGAIRIIDRELQNGKKRGEMISQVMSELNETYKKSPEMLEFIKAYQNAISTSNWKL